MNKVAYIRGYMEKVADRPEVTDTTTQPTAQVPSKSKVSPTQIVSTLLKVQRKYGPLIDKNIPLAGDQVVQMWDDIKELMPDKQAAKAIDTLLKKSDDTSQAVIKYIGDIFGDKSQSPVTFQNAVDFLTEGLTSQGVGALPFNRKYIAKNLESIANIFSSAKQGASNITRLQELQSDLLKGSWSIPAKKKILTEIKDIWSKTNELAESITKDTNRVNSFSKIMSTINWGRKDPASFIYPIEQDIMGTVAAASNKLVNSKAESSTQEPHLVRRVKRLVQLGNEATTPEKKGELISEGGRVGAAAVSKKIIRNIERPLAWTAQKLAPYTPRLANLLRSTLPQASLLKVGPVIGTGMDIIEGVKDYKQFEQSVDTRLEDLSNMHSSVGSMLSPVKHLYNTVKDPLSPVKTMTAIAKDPLAYASNKVHSGRLAVDGLTSRVFGHQVTPARSLVDKANVVLDKVFKDGELASVARLQTAATSPIRLFQTPLKENAQQQADDFKNAKTFLFRNAGNIKDYLKAKLRSTGEKLRDKSRFKQAPDIIPTASRVV